ncbi:MAG: hypothetical protein LBK99_24475 [Opitutaceae bacterium]|nr:hypothetical protein [Opitutaceae bacterium]
MSLLIRRLRRLRARRPRHLCEGLHMKPLLEASFRDASSKKKSVVARGPEAGGTGVVDAWKTGQ